MPNRTTQLVEQLILAGVEVNDYDDDGSAVLMFFITQLHDGDDGKTLAHLIEYLIPSEVNVHWRNRRGKHHSTLL